MKPQVVADRWITNRFRRDLERGVTLKTRYGIIVPDIIFRHEFQGKRAGFWAVLGFELQYIDSEGVKLASRYSKEYSTVALADCFALVLAQQTSYSLVTADEKLRTIAGEKNVHCLNLEGILL